MTSHKSATRIWSMSPPVKFFTDRSKAALLSWILCVISFLNLLCFCARLCIDGLWSPAGKGPTSLLSFVMSNYEIVTFPLVSLVRCGAWLYRFLIFALFLTFMSFQCLYHVRCIIQGLFYRRLESEYTPNVTELCRRLMSEVNIVKQYASFFLRYTMHVFSK